MVKLVDPVPGSEERPARRRGGWLLALVALFTLGGFAGSIWYAYDQGMEKGITLSPPLIRADPSPTKVKPDDPGGLEVPHQDKLVYETLTGERPTETAERLLPPPEEPLSRPPPEPSQPPAPPQPTEPQAAPPAAAPAPSLGGSEPGALAVAAVTPAVIAPPAAPRPEPEPPTVVATREAPPPAAVASFRIQLAAYREAGAATLGWNKLSRTNPSLLKGLRPNVVRVDLGVGKGIFYRLQAGPLPDRETADTLCAELKRQKVGCLVVAP